MLGAAAEVSGAAVVSLGFALLRTGSTVDTHLALAVVGCVGCGTAVLPDAVVRTCVACPLLEATAAVVGLPLLACVPFPSVPALPRGGLPPPLSESLAWRIAWRNGCTPSAMPATTVIPASTVTNRSHPIPHPRKFPRRDRRSRSAPSLGSDSCQAQ